MIRTRDLADLPAFANALEQRPLLFRSDLYCDSLISKPYHSEHPSLGFISLLMVMSARTPCQVVKLNALITCDFIVVVKSLVKDANSTILETCCVLADQLVHLVSDFCNTPITFHEWGFLKAPFITVYGYKGTHVLRI